jgi:osmotically-inducible protein OsmY
MFTIQKTVLVIGVAALLQGCVTAAVIGVVGGGVSVVNDNRTLSNQIDDTKIEFAAHSALENAVGLADNTNLQVVSVNSKVLVVGQAPNTHLRDLAIKTLNSLVGVEQVYDQIRIGNITSFTTTSNDMWLTSKVKTALFSSNSLTATQIKVVTENGEVFLMGLVNSSQANAAVEAARNINGVSRVFKMFEYVSK